MNLIIKNFLIISKLLSSLEEFCRYCTDMLLDKRVYSSVISFVNWEKFRGLYRDSFCPFFTIMMKVNRPGYTSHRPVKTFSVDWKCSRRLSIDTDAIRLSQKLEFSRILLQRTHNLLLLTDTP